MLNRTQIAIWVAALGVGLVFLPAWLFVGLSAIVVLALPTARWPRAYPRLLRIIASLVIAGIGFLCSWGVQIAIAGGTPLPLAQLVPALGGTCEVSQRLLADLSMQVSPVCRLLLQDPRAEYGFGFFSELLLLINLVWIRLSNLHPSLRDSEFIDEGSSGLWLLVVTVCALAFGTQVAVSLLASLIDGPYEIPHSVAYGGAALYIACVSSLQLSLYPARRRGL